MLTKEQAKILLSKSLKHMTPEERKKIKEAIKLLANSWGVP
jgi:hypothetical protein